MDSGDVLVDIANIGKGFDSLVDHIFDGNDDDRASFELMIVPNGVLFLLRRATYRELVPVLMAEFLRVCRSSSVCCLSSATSSVLSLLASVAGGDEITAASGKIPIVASFLGGEGNILEIVLLIDTISSVDSLLAP